MFTAYNSKLEYLTAYQLPNCNGCWVHRILNTDIWLWSDYNFGSIKDLGTLRDLIIVIYEILKADYDRF